MRILIPFIGFNFIICTFAYILLLINFFSYMKRLTFFLTLAAMPLALFAYYGEYDNEPSSFVQLLMFIFLVWGILEVILFFKIWGMTKNVKNISNNILRTNTRELLRKYRLLGNKDKAAEILIQEFLNEMEKTIHSGSYNSGQNIEEEVAELEFQLAQLEQKLPEKFKKLKTAGDYEKLGRLKTRKLAQYEEEKAARMNEKEHSPEK